MICNPKNLIISTVFIATITGLAPAWAGSAADFFKGKTITLLSPSPGGAYSLYANVLSRHWPRHIPGKPDMIVQPKPGGGGAAAARYLFNAAPREGTAVAMLFKDMALMQVLLTRKIAWDFAKFGYIGSMGPLNNTISIFHTAPAKTLEQAKSTELILGSMSKRQTLYMYPMVLNRILGTKFKVITGYRGGRGIRGAIERGELHGSGLIWSGWKMTKPDWLRDGKLIQLVQIGPAKAPDLPNVPLLTDFARNADERRALEFLSSTAGLGWYVATTPDVPKDRLNALQNSFAATMTDPRFLAEAKKRRLEIAPISAKQVTKIVQQIIGVDKAVLEQARELAGLK